MTFIKLIVWFACFVFSVNLMGQESQERNPYINTKNKLVFSFETGLNRSKVVSTKGEDYLKPMLSVSPKLSMDYLFHITDNFGLTVGGGLGFFAAGYNSINSRLGLF